MIFHLAIEGAYRELYFLIAILIYIPVNRKIPKCTFCLPQNEFVQRIFRIQYNALYQAVYTMDDFFRYEICESIRQNKICCCVYRAPFFQILFHNAYK